MTRLQLAGSLLLAVAIAACGDAKTGETSDSVASSDAVLVLCQDNAGCDDGDPCSADRCDGGFCTHSVAVGAACDDGDACTAGDQCGSNGLCGGAGVTLPGPACATCSCDPVAGVTCVAVAIGTACDDKDCCTPSSRCAACDPATDPDCPAWEALCAGTPDACEDGNDCTTDSCACDDDNQRVCAYADGADDTPCEADPNACTTADTCQGGHCVLGTPLDLDDNNPCTVDRCVKGDVVHDLANTGQCDDGNECTQDDHCALGTCVGGPAVECAKPDCASSVSCIPGTGCVAVWKPAESLCEDHDACTTESVCDADHACVPSVSLTRDDGDACTVDSCDPVTGEVTHTATTLTCGDDQNPCTIDTCNPATGACSVPIPDGSTVPDADLCDGVETCHGGQVKDGAAISCTGVTNPCLAKTCNPNSGACDLPVADHTPCSDADLCDGAETCQGGACAEGTAVDCSGVTHPCILPQCNSATGACDLAVDDGTSCADADVCDGDEVCLGGECYDGEPVDCSGTPTPCLLPQCNSATGACDLPVDDDTSCADANACNGVERCLAGVCQPGTPLTCPDDGQPCTDDVCVPETGLCGVLRTSGTGELVIQPGPEEQLDKFVGSAYDSDPNGVRPDLAVGGWGDQYWSQWRFELAGQPTDILGATIGLYCGTGVYNPSKMWLDRIDGPWTLTTTWAQKPAGTQLREVPACAAAESWYALDVSDLAPGWLSGAVANWGIRLRPQGTNHQFNSFWSADYTDDPSLRPYLALAYDCATYPTPCADSDVCTAVCEGTPCDDGDPCTSGDTCTGGACVPSDGGDCQDDGDPCTAETCTAEGCEHVWTCAETTDGAVAYEVVPALDANGLLHTAGRVVPVNGSAAQNDPHRIGKSYALRSSDLGVVWGPLSTASNCAKNAGPKMPAVDDTLGYVYTHGDWNDGQIGDYCASIFAKRAADGVAVWDQQPSGPHPRHEIALSAARAYYGGCWGRLKSFDLANGAILSSFDFAVGYSEGGGVVLTSNDDMIATQRTFKIERWTPAGTRVWTATTLKGELHMTRGDNVVGWNPDLDALVYVDGATGAQVWTATAPGGNGAILTDAAGALYFGEGDGAASVDIDGAARWSTPLGGPAAAQFLGDDGLLYVRTWSTLYALEAETGAVVWRFDAVAGQVSVDGVTKDNGFAGTFGLLADGDIFGSDYAGRTYRLATTGLDYAAAPWARPRGNRRNSAKVWDVAPLP